MSVTDHAVATDVGGSLPVQRVAARSWLAQLAMLGVVLFGSFHLLSPGVYTIDENAYRAQVAQLVDQETWAVPIVPGPTGVPTLYAPLALSDVQTDVWFPYARHAAYPASLAAVDPLAEGSGGLLLSALSLLAVALIAGAATDRLPNVDGRLGFWLAASASPFLVHAHIGWAHLPAAAAFGAAVAIVHNADRWSISGAVGVAVGVGVAVLLRTEGLLASAALFGAIAVAPRRASERVRWLGTVGASAAVAFGIDRLLFRWATGSVSFAPTGVAESTDNIFVHRLQATVALFLDVGGATPQHVARLLAALLLVAAAILVRRRRDVGMVVVLSLLGLALGLYGTLNGDSYPGLFAAWPVLAPAIVLVGRPSIHRFPLTVIGGTWGALVLVSPPDGGGLGWGGRLGVITLVASVPIVATAVNSSRSRQSVAQGAGIVMAVALLLSVAVSAVGLRTIDSARETSLAVEAQVTAALEPLVGTEEVLISTDRRLGRIAPDVAIRLPLQSMADDSELAEFLAAADAASISRVVHVDLFDNDHPIIPPGWQASEATFEETVRLIVIERMPS